MIRKDPLAKQILQKGNDSDDDELWITKYFPENREEIPLFKISQVKKFEEQLELCFSGYPGSPKVIIITGPVGCGKTTLVKVICKEKEIDITEFIPEEEELPFFNPETNSNAEFNPFITKLHFFLERSQSQQVTNFHSSQLLLIDDISINPNDRNQFIEILTQYNISKRHLLPLIWIADQNDVYQKIPNCYSFSYPAASPTVLKRVIKRIVNKEHLQHVNINEIINLNPGDVRLAVNTLQFLYQHKSPSNAPISSTGRPESLSYFQSLGEILYQKNRLTSEDILKISHCTPTMMINGLFENALDFFAEVSEYADAADNFSLADEMLESSWSIPALTEIATTTTMRGVLTAIQTPTKTDFRKMRAGFKSHLKRDSMKSDLYHEEVQILDAYNKRPYRFIDDDDDDDFVPDNEFLCWPSQYKEETSQMMDDVLFNRGSIRYNVNSYQNQMFETRKKDRYLAQLAEQKRLLEEDPIEMDDDDFFKE